MKDKIFMFIIGILVGAVLSTGAFYLYTATTSSNCGNQEMQMNGEEPPEKPDGENGVPPEKPDGEEGEPPEKPSE